MFKRPISIKNFVCRLYPILLEHLQHFRQAEKMVAYGLSGNPPETIAEELREAWQELMEKFQQQAA